MKSFSYKALLVLGLLLVPSVSAQEAQKEKLQGMIDATLDVIYSQTHASLSANEKQAKVREKLESCYDLDVMIRYAIVIVKFINRLALRLGFEPPFTQHKTHRIRGSLPEPCFHGHYLAVSWRQCYCPA